MQSAFNIQEYLVLKVCVVCTCS